MKSGFIPAGKSSDEIIAGSERGGELPPESDPEAEEPGSDEVAPEAEESVA
jgi:hypothetical protein